MKNYNVEISQTGRGGTIYYSEGDDHLSFDWEFSMTGATILVPAPHQWDASCERSGFAGAKGRRQEILERTGEEVCRQQTGRFEIGDQYLEIIF